MAVLNGHSNSGDEGLLRIWNTISELGEQLSQHRQFTANLQAQIGVLKVRVLQHRHFREEADVERLSALWAV